MNIVSLVGRLVKKQKEKLLLLVRVTQDLP